MDQKRKIFLGKCVAVLSAVPFLVYAYSSGPLPRKTGVPGEGLCTDCHSGTAVNAGGGKVEVAFSSGLTYSPGQKQRLTINISDPSARIYGFQLTARLANNEANGQAGRLDPVPGDTGVFVLCADGSARGGGSCPASAAVESIEHNLPRSAGSFQVDWTPPATDQGPVKIYVAGNAANGDGTNSGDHIYAANYALTAVSPGDGPALAQSNAVVNGASFQPGIAPGAWISIFGSSLASNSRTWRDDEIVNGKLPAQLDGISVKIDGKPAAVYYISATQLNVQAPDDNASGNVPVEVTTPQGTVSTTAVMQQFAPGMFMYDPESRKYIAAQHGDFSIVGKPNLFSNAASTPAKPGEVIILYATGFGPTSPAVPAGQVVTQAAPLADLSQLTVRIGNVTAQVQFAGVTIAGVWQLNVKIPDSLPDGDALVVAEIGGLRTQDNAYITIQK